MRLEIFRAFCEWPAQVEPSWKDSCERWQLLDAAAYALAEAWSNLVEKNRGLAELRIGGLVLACEGASNTTDHDFTRGGSLSPSKFVHTLSNVRISSFLQVSKFHGPLLCLQNGKETLLSGFTEALFEARMSGKLQLLISLRPQNSTTHEVLLALIGDDSGVPWPVEDTVGLGSLKLRAEIGDQAGSLPAPLADDKALWQAIEDQRSPGRVGPWLFYLQA